MPTYAVTLDNGATITFEGNLNGDLSSGGPYPADATGVETGTQTPDPIRTTDAFQWVQFPSDGVALAWGIAGDDFPRVVFGADPSDFGLVMLGDGTFDPTVSGPAVVYSTLGGLSYIQVPHLQFGNDVDATLMPTADPHVSGRLWANSGVVTVSAG